MTLAAVQQRPERLIQAIFNSDGEGQPVLPDWGREEALAWLKRMLVDFDCLKGHLSLLQTLYVEPFEYDRPSPLAQGAYRLPLGGETSKFRHRDPLPDDRIVAVADQGPGALSNRELAELLLNPVALIDLSRAIDVLSPEAWHEAWHEAGQAWNDAGSGSKSDPSVMTFEPKTVKAPRPLSWLSRASALAASLFLGALIGSMAFRGPGDVSRPGDWSATATYFEAGTRGANESRRFKIASNLDGFATIITLSPGNAPDVTPGVGGALIRVKPGSPVQSQPLAPGSTKAAVALVVVTETPSDADIRRALNDRTFEPEEYEQLRSFLDRKLRDLNHRQIAFTRVEIPAGPK